MNESKIYKRILEYKTKTREYSEIIEKLIETHERVNNKNETTISNYQLEKKRLETQQSRDIETMKSLYNKIEKLSIEIQKLNEKISKIEISNLTNKNEDQRIIINEHILNKLINKLINKLMNNNAQKLTY